jgi:hypothetical protein
MERKRQNKSDQTWIGLLAGLLLPAIVFFVFYFIKKSGLPFIDYIKGLWQLRSFIQLISLCVAANILVFMLFIKLKFDRSARGVLGATILYAFIVLIIRSL